MQKVFLKTGNQSLNYSQFLKYKKKSDKKKFSPWDQFKQGRISKSKTFNSFEINGPSNNKNKFVKNYKRKSSRKKTIKVFHYFTTISAIFNSIEQPFLL